MTKRNKTKTKQPVRYFFIWFLGLITGIIFERNAKYFGNAKNLLLSSTGTLSYDDEAMKIGVQPTTTATTSRRISPSTTTESVGSAVDDNQNQQQQQPRRRPLQIFPLLKDLRCGWYVWYIHY